MIPRFTCCIKERTDCRLCRRATILFQPADCRRDSVTAQRGESTRIIESPELGPRGGFQKRSWILVRVSRRRRLSVGREENYGNFSSEYFRFSSARASLKSL